AFAAMYAFATGLMRRRVGWWFAGGALTGLAYLTKGSAHLLLIAAAGMAIFQLRWEALKRPTYIAAAIGGFVFSGWWLLWRNISVFGSPFYNFNNRAAWLDRWSDVWVIQRTAEW